MCIRDRYLDNLPPDLQGQANAYADAAEQLMQGERTVSYTHLDVYKRQLEKQLSNKGTLNNRTLIRIVFFLVRFITPISIAIVLLHGLKVI